MVQNRHFDECEEWRPINMERQQENQKDEIKFQNFHNFVGKDQLNYQCPNWLLKINNKIFHCTFYNNLRNSEH